MTQTQERRKEPAERTGSGVLKLEFGSGDAFGKELRRRVDEFFQSSGRRKRGGWPMYFKTAVILAWFASSYALLVFGARTLGQGLPLAVSLGLATAAIGMSIQHDAGHGAYSDRSGVNRIMAMTMELIGGSSYTWRWKHTIIHHKYVNITGYDADIAIGRLGRFSPQQRRLWYPAISGIVERTCREFGIPYKEHKSFSAGLAAHSRWLRRTAWRIDS